MRDEEGVDLPDLRAAHRFALRLIEKVIEDHADAIDWRTSAVEINDAAGNTLLNVLFRGGISGGRVRFGRRTSDRRLNPA